MASAVDICNNALAYLGDTAQVASITPPSGSSQAAYCARFYPMALATFMDTHAWSFATLRVQPPLLYETNQPNSWTYAYQVPPDCVKILSVLDPNATDDYSAGLPNYGNVVGATDYNIGLYTPQLYTTETDANGNQVLYTNQANAELRYIQEVSNPAILPASSVEALTWLLAAKLAGPVIKGTEGRTMAKYCLEQYQMFLSAAKDSDSNNRSVRPAPSTDWIVNR